MAQCTVAACESPAIKRGWCQKHYTRWHRYGDPTFTKVKMHGRYNTPEYKIWCAMKQRCLNPNEKMFYLYGGRGIAVCDRWKESFEAFYKDMGPKPKSMSIERVDNDGNYEPSNCRWATSREQAANRRPTHRVTFNGVTKSLKWWCDDLGLSYQNIWDRVHTLGWTYEKALTTPVRKRG